MFFLNIKNELTLRLPEPLSQNKTTMSKATKQRKRKDAPPPRAVDNNWLTSLIQQSGPAADVPSKAERIQKRQAKKRRREERQQHHEATPSFLQERRRVEADERSNKNTSQSTSKKLKSLAKCMQTCVADFEIKKRNMYVSKEPKGKAVVWKKWTPETVQPRKRDYGGLGIARPSMFLALSDPSFMPKLEQEFQEHIPGFFGKQRTKAMKKQLDGNMLWRQLAEKRYAKVNGRKLSDMTPDERVEALIAAGHL
jgi:DNA polymerase III gamma/tau subunit